MSRSERAAAVAASLAEHSAAEERQAAAVAAAEHAHAGGAGTSRLRTPSEVETDAALDASLRAPVRHGKGKAAAVYRERTTSDGSDSYI